MILDGKKVQEKIKSKIKEKVSLLGEKVPELAIIQVGDNAASNAYIKRKIDFGNDVGIKVIHHKFSETSSEEEILNLIEKLNCEENVGGIIVQLPLPEGFDKEKILGRIDKKKDVDGLNGSDFIPATASAVMSLLDFYEISLKDKKVLVIGRSALVGKPVAEECRKKGAQVEVANSKTTPGELVELCQHSEIIISAVGLPKLINEKHVNSSHIIVDVGITRIDGKLVGDVDFENVYLKVFAISPVPGGVGPLTVASLFKNLII